MAIKINIADLQPVVFYPKFRIKEKQKDGTMVEKTVTAKDWDHALELSNGGMVISMTPAYSNHNPFFR